MDQNVNTAGRVSHCTDIWQRPCQTAATLLDCADQILIHLSYLILTLLVLAGVREKATHFLFVIQPGPVLKITVL